jgi:hypothetical protein
MAYTDNMEYIIRGGWDEASQSYTGCVTPNDGVISECRVRELVEVFSATEEELKTAYERCRWEDIRIERDRLIAETDYMALQDTSELSDEWKTYRQELRDIPTSQSDPDDVVWPTKPS